MNKLTCFLMFMAKKTKGIVALPLFLLFLVTSPVSNAQNRISLAVGQSYTLPAPTHFGARIYSAQWSCQTTDVSAQTLSDFSGKITVVRAFTGDVRVTCYYSYSYTINGFSYTGTSAEYYLVECSSGGGGGGGGSGNETGVSLDPMSMNVNLNNPYTTDYIGACALPAGAQSTFTWTSTNPSVATVKITSTTANCSNGYIVANSEGTCYIKVTTANGYTKQCLVTVTSNGGGGGGSNNETGVSLSSVPDTVYLNNPQVGISACAVPSNAQTTFAWSTTNPSVATVKITNETASCSNGYIVANGVGTCYIKVITAKGYTQQRKVTVANVPVNNGDKFMVNGITYKKLTNTTCEVTYNDSSSTGFPTPTYSGNISIPIQVLYGGTTYNVTAIGRNAFLGCASLASITIPSSVTTIGDSAFSNCSRLTSVTIPSSVTTIGNYAFYICIALASVTIPSSVTTIGNSAFCGCRLASVTIPSSVTTIGDWAFSNCSSLTSVTIPSSVTTIGVYAFGDCRALASVTIPSSVTTIGYQAFSNVKMIYYQGSASGQPWGALCMNGYIEDSLYYTNAAKNNLTGAHSAITKALIPNTVTTIGDYAFYNCSALASVTIPSSVTTIGNYAFYNCSSLTSVTIPSSVTTIGNYAFYICIALTSVTIPSSVTTIGNSAFWNCRLASVTIPSSVTTIGNAAFANCSALASVTIPSSVTTIGNVAFSNCSALTSVTIPSSVTTIGNSAFSNCTSLKVITVSSGNTKYSSQDGVLYDMNKTELICCPGGYSDILNIPNTVTTIGDYAFCGCRLASVTIPSSVTTIGDRAFYNCSALTSVTIPSSVTTIGNAAFSNCTSLKVITVSSGNTKYSSQDGVLYDMNKTELICCPGGYSDILNIPNTVTTIGDYAFSNCSSLTSVTIPSSVTTIGDYAFSNCSSLTSVTIPSSVTTIGYQAFSNVKMIYYQGSASGQPWGALCMNGYLEDSLYYSSASKTNLISAHSAITKALIPNTVTTIGNNAFYDCRALASVTIPSSVTTIGNNAFYDCSALASVTIPSSVTIIGNNAFNKCKTVWMRSITPPSMGGYMDGDSLSIVVPHKAYKDYLKAGINYTRHRICCDTIMVTATVNDKTSGYIVGVDPVYTFPYANPLQIELKAEPYQGRCFVQWNDGDTTNPRLVTLLCDTSFTAYFQGVGVSEAENGDVPFAYAESGCIVVKNLQHPELVEISDVTGRRLFRGMVSETSRIPVRASAVYFVRIGGRPAQKVVLIR